MTKFKKIQDIRLQDLIAWNIICLGLIIVLITEIFGIFNLINKDFFKIIWFLILLVLSYQLYLILYLKNKYILKKVRIFSIKNLILICILLPTFITALVYPPNTWDSMTYHLPKVMQWIQNQNVNFYPTSDIRQLIMPPFAEYVILNFYLIFNNDIFSNLAQWFSMFFTLLIITFVTRELGGNSKAQFFSLVFVITLPMGILQSSSTQTDYVTSLWLVCFIYFFLKYSQDKKFKNIIGLSISLGLSVLTKPTAYLFAFPFCLWLFFLLIKDQQKFKKIFTILFLFLVINIGHYLRNFSIYNNPLGINSEGFVATNEKLNILVFLSNLIRNLVLNFSFPFSFINEKTHIFVEKLHLFLGISITDQSTTVGSDYFIPFSLYESTAPNTLHFLIIIFTLIFFILFKKNFLKFRKLSLYLFSLIFAFCLFSIVMKWQPYGNRLILPLFILIAPFVSIILSNKKYFLRILIFFLFVYSIPYVFFNKSRPLLAEIKKINNKEYTLSRTFLKTKTRDELYFVRRPELFKKYLEISKIIKDRNCKNIGLIISDDNWEYPLWKFVKENNNKHKIFHININNSSKKFTYNLIAPKPCAVVQIADKNNKNLYLNTEFSEQIYREPLKLFIN